LRAQSRHVVDVSEGETANGGPFPSKRLGLRLNDPPPESGRERGPQEDVRSRPRVAPGVKHMVEAEDGHAGAWRSSPSHADHFLPRPRQADASAEPLGEERPRPGGLLFQLVLPETVQSAALRQRALPFASRVGFLLEYESAVDLSSPASGTDRASLAEAVEQRFEDACQRIPPWLLVEVRDWTSSFRCARILVRSQPLRGFPVARVRPARPAETFENSAEKKSPLVVLHGILAIPSREKSLRACATDAFSAFT